MYSVDKDGDKVVYSAVITGIPVSSFDRVFDIRGYVKALDSVEAGDDEKYVDSGEPVEKSVNGVVAALQKKDPAVKLDETGALVREKEDGTVEKITNDDEIFNMDEPTVEPTATPEPTEPPVVPTDEPEPTDTPAPAVTAEPVYKVNFAEDIRLESGNRATQTIKDDGTAEVEFGLYCGLFYFLPDTAAMNNSNYKHVYVTYTGTGEKGPQVYLPTTNDIDLSDPISSFGDDSKEGQSDRLTVAEKNTTKHYSSSNVSIKGIQMFYWGHEGSGATLHIKSVIFSESELTQEEINELSGIEPDTATEPPAAPTDTPEPTEPPVVPTDEPEPTDTPAPAVTAEPVYKVNFAEDIRLESGNRATQTIKDDGTAEVEFGLYCGLFYFLPDTAAMNNSNYKHVYVTYTGTGEKGPQVYLPTTNDIDLSDPISSFGDDSKEGQSDRLTVAEKNTTKHYSSSNVSIKGIQMFYWGHEGSGATLHIKSVIFSESELTQEEINELSGIEPDTATEPPAAPTDTPEPTEPPVVPTDEPEPTDTPAPTEPPAVPTDTPAPTEEPVPDGPAEDIDVVFSPDTAHIAAGSPYWYVDPANNTYNDDGSVSFKLPKGGNKAIGFYFNADKTGIDVSKYKKAVVTLCSSENNTALCANVSNDSNLKDGDGTKIAENGNIIAGTDDISIEFDLLGKEGTGYGLVLQHRGWDGNSPDDPTITVKQIKLIAIPAPPEGDIDVVFSPDTAHIAAGSPYWYVDPANNTYNDDGSVSFKLPKGGNKAIGFYFNADKIGLDVSKYKKAVVTLCSSENNTALCANVSNDSNLKDGDGTKIAENGNIIAGTDDISIEFDLLGKEGTGYGVVIQHRGWDGNSPDDPTITVKSIQLIALPPVPDGPADDIDVVFSPDTAHPVDKPWWYVDSSNNTYNDDGSVSFKLPKDGNKAIGFYFNQDKSGVYVSKYKKAVVTLSSSENGTGLRAAIVSDGNKLDYTDDTKIVEKDGIVAGTDDISFEVDLSSAYGLGYGIVIQHKGWGTDAIEPTITIKSIKLLSKSPQPTTAPVQPTDAPEEPSVTASPVYKVSFADDIKLESSNKATQTMKEDGTAQVKFGELQGVFYFLPDTPQMRKSNYKHLYVTYTGTGSGDVSLYLPTTGDIDLSNPLAPFNDNKKEQSDKLAAAETDTTKHYSSSDVSIKGIQLFHLWGDGPTLAFKSVIFSENELTQEEINELSGIVPDTTYDTPAGFMSADDTAAGTVEDITYESTAVSDGAIVLRKAKVVLPKGYSEDKQYPVVYMLHGIGGNETSLYGDKTQYVFWNAAAAGTAKDMIAVFPNVCANETGKPPVGEDGEEKFFSTEHYAAYDNFVNDLEQCLMPYINENYSTLTGRENTAICGFSMGGREALYIGLTRAEHFGYVGGFCPAYGLFAYPPNWTGVGEDGMFSSETDFKPADGYSENTLILVVKGKNDTTVHEQPYLYHTVLEDNNVPHLYYETLGGDSENIGGGGHDGDVYKHGLYNLITRMSKSE